jgi:hypothetical protein
MFADAIKNIFTALKSNAASMSKWLSVVKVCHAMTAVIASSSTA